MHAIAKYSGGRTSEKRCAASRGVPWLVAALAISLSIFFPQSLHAQLPPSLGWTALPATTSLSGSGACPPDGYGGDPYPFAEYCQNVIRAWSGAIADTTGNRLIIWGGGHINYYGNEIYALNLTANPITLLRLKDPTVPTNYANDANCVDGIPPGSPNFAPNSRESYEGMAFVANLDLMYITGGALACLNGYGSTDTWTISLDNLSDSSMWFHEDPTISGPFPGSDGGDLYGMIADYDPNSGLVFLSDGAALYTYDYTTNTHALITPTQGFITSIYLSGGVDPYRKLFVVMGGCGGGTCSAGNGVFVADISDPTSTTQQDWTAATMADANCAEFLSGGVNPILATNPGVTFDSVANDFVGWPNQGNSVYIMTPDTTNQRFTCQKLTFANGPPNSAQNEGGANTSNGTFGRFRYFPALDVFVVVNDWNIPPYILRLRSPSITSLDPTSITEGSAQFTLTVTGTNFLADSVVNFNGMAVTTDTTGEPTSLAATIPATLVAMAGTFPVTVTQNGQTSNSVNFTVNVASAPTITALSPTSVAADSSQFTLTVTGTNFLADSVVNFNGTAVTTDTTGQPTSLAATIPATLIAIAGTFPVTITQSGLTSNSVNFTVSPPAPDFKFGTITSSPADASVTAGGSVVYTIPVIAIGSFSSSVTLTCTSGLPAKANCSAASATPATPATLTISTIANSIAPPAPGARRNPYVPLAVAIVCFEAFILALFVFVRPSARPRRIAVALSFFALLLLLPLGSCGGGSSGGSSVGVENTGTPPGSYTITMTGTSGSLTHTTSVTLIVGD
ncbi:MAG: hypothetical protein WBL70_01380 [Candidatus Acidiferrales bacterium]